MHACFCSVKGCHNNDVRLVDGITPLEGRVEICTNDVWSTICDRSWDILDTRVVCRQLGFSSLGKDLTCCMVIAES